MTGKGRLWRASQARSLMLGWGAPEIFLHLLPKFSHGKGPSKLRDFWAPASLASTENDKTKSTGILPGRTDRFCRAVDFAESVEENVPERQLL